MVFMTALVYSLSGSPHRCLSGISTNTSSSAVPPFFLISLSPLKMQILDGNSLTFSSACVITPRRANHFWFFDHPSLLQFLSRPHGFLEDDVLSMFTSQSFTSPTNASATPVFPCQPHLVDHLFPRDSLPHASFWTLFFCLSG